MAELMQSAKRSSSSCPVLSRLSMERSEREELKLLLAFGSKVFPPIARWSAVSDAPVEDPELPDLVVSIFILHGVPLRPGGECVPLVRKF